MDHGSIEDRTELDRAPEPALGRRFAAEPALGRRLAAELAGTFALVFVAVGGDAMARLASPDISTAARAVAPGLLVAAWIYAVGDVSGAHLNPAVTLAFVLKRLFPVGLLPSYWLAQIAGAVVASGTVGLLFGDALAAGVSTPHVTTPTAVALEGILAAILVTVVLGTADRARIVGPNAAIAVGATIALCGLIALPIEGASMNPARSLGPALVAGRLEDAWLYVVGPIAGSIAAVLLTRFLHGPKAGDAAASGAATGDAPGA